MTCQAPRCCRIETTTFLYSRDSSLVASPPRTSSRISASTQSADPGPVTPEPTRAPRHRPQQCCGLATRQLPELLDRRDDTDEGVLAAEARHDQNLVSASYVGCVDRRLPFRVVECDRHDHAWQHDHICERQNRELLSV